MTPATVTLTPLALALIGGVIPALIWLWFWRHEDRKRPEPRGRIIATFLAGMLAVAVALPLEELVSPYFTSGLLLFLAWAVIEEGVKFLAAYVTALRTRINDEPIDAVIYMLTAALGFAALETGLFIFTPMKDGFFLEGLLTSNMRFLGATVLHTLASGIVGAFIGLSFYRNQKIKHRYLFLGLILATALHALFNFFIMQSEIFTVFGIIWIFLFFLLLFFEKVKTVQPFKRRK